MSVLVKTSQVLRKAQRAGFMRATLICCLICPSINNFCLFMYLFLTIAFLPEIREMNVFHHSQWFGFLFFSLNFCSADMCVSVFLRPAMNLDKSGWSLE